MKNLDFRKLAKTNIFFTEEKKKISDLRNNRTEQKVQKIEKLAFCENFEKKNFLEIGFWGCPSIQPRF